MEREKAIDLIKKVLAKAGNNPNQNEIEVATLKAQELMIKYGLSMDEVSTGDKPNRDVEENCINDNGKMNWYISRLSNVVAKNFRCDSFIRSKLSGKYIQFVGYKEDVKIAKEVFCFVKESLEYFADQYIKNLYYEQLTKDIYSLLNDYTGCKNDFIKGFILGLDAKFKEQVDKNAWGLVVIKPEAVIDYMENLNLKKGRSTTVKTSRSTEHYSEGYKTGKSLEYRKDLLKGQAN